MRELNPIGRDQDQLLLESDDGEKFSVAIDETLKKTIRESRLPDLSGEELSPREIQDAIRGGSTVAELAASSGGNIDLIERFAHPVLEELAHMVELAKSIRVELPADRFNDIEKKAFGEVVEAKLLQGGATKPSWSARRGDNSVWEIVVEFEQSGGTGSATWTFDPRKYLLTPETSNAASLSTPSSNLDSPLSAPPRTLVNEVESQTSVVTADKLEAFRKRREQTEALAPVDNVPADVTELESEADEIQFSVDESSQIELESVGEEPQLEVIEIVAEPTVTETKRSRPPMPSWDEIVRGTQSDDGEVF